MKNWKKVAIGTLTLTSLAITPLAFAKDAKVAHTPKASVEKQEGKASAQHLKASKKSFSLIVDSISGNTLTARNKKNESYTVDMSGAKLLRRFGGKSSADEISAGDHVVVVGKVDSNDAHSLIATRVQDVSNHRYQGKIWGTVESVGDGTFTVLNGKVKYTVSVISDTTFHGNKNHQLNALSDLQEGDRVVIKGTRDDANKTEKAENVQLLGVKKGGTMKVKQHEKTEKSVENEKTGTTETTEDTTK